MKKTGLKPGGPLSRSSSKGPKRKGTRKPSMAGFWAAVMVRADGRCALERLGGCVFAPMDAHHFVLEQRLPTLEAKLDPRNGVALCRVHHDAVHSANGPACPRPPLLDEFLADHGLLESGRPDPKREAA